VSVIPKLFADFCAQGDSEIWNIQISDQVTAPVIRATIKRGHGNMRGGAGAKEVVSASALASARPKPLAEASLAMA
jgi:hypothetical protein